MSVARRRIVLGLGNLLNRDEGLGIHALRALVARTKPQSSSPSPGGGKATAAAVEFLDGGTLGLNLLPLVEEASHLLILDAVDAGQAPGTLVELTKDELPLFAGLKLSEHQITIQEVLGLAKFRDRLPDHLHLIGAQPADLGVGTDLSPTLAPVIPDIVARAGAVLDEWNLL